jgi:hypothetical protein
VSQRGMTSAAPLASLGLRAEDLGRGGSLIFCGAGVGSALGPAAGDLVLLETRASSANQASIAPGSTPFSRPISSRRVAKLMEWPAPEVDEEGLDMRIAVLGVDLGKNGCGG